ncbi:MAG: PhoU domain-containing protein [Pseudonocardiaceae bacterium]
MMTNASIALHQKDLALAALVIADCDQIKAMHKSLERRCITLLALEAPIAGDLRSDRSLLRAFRRPRGGHCAVRLLPGYRDEVRGLRRCRAGRRR